MSTSTFYDEKMTVATSHVTTAEFKGVGYLHAYTSLINMLICLGAFFSPCIWYTKSQNTFWGIPYWCQDAPQGSSEGFHCHGYDDSTPDTPLENDTEFVLYFVACALGSILIAAIFGNTCCCRVRRPLAVFSFYLCFALELAGSGLLLRAMIYMTYESNSIKTLKEASDGSWSFSFYALWIGVGLSNISGVLALVTGRVESLVQEEVAFQYKPDSEVREPELFEQKEPVHVPSAEMQIASLEAQDSRFCGMRGCVAGDEFPEGPYDTPLPDGMKRACA
jgi:hypothetical protein